MKNLFPHYETQNIEDYDAVWKSALFVFDTSVLLGLYRVTAETRAQLTDALAALGGQIWIPHHVALEYQRNRLAVVADRIRHADEVRKSVSAWQDQLGNLLNRLHLDSHRRLLDSSKLQTSVHAAVAQFVADLDEVAKSLQRPNEVDTVLAKLEELFEGKVGPPPASQNVLDAHFKTAAERYKKNIPPGYLDQGKGDEGVDVYCDGQLAYSRRYGDYLIWRQMLDYAESSDIKKLVFVTADEKEDWWQILKVSGKQKIGPRPELRAEARMVGVESLLFYTLPQFLKYATRDSVDSVASVRELAALVTEPFWNKHSQYQLLEGSEASNAVVQFLRSVYPHTAINRHGFPDYVIHDGDVVIGADGVILTEHIELETVWNIVAHARATAVWREYHEMIIVWVVPNAQVLDLVGAIVNAMNKELPRISMYGACRDGVGEHPWKSFGGFAFRRLGDTA